MKREDIQLGTQVCVVGPDQTHRTVVTINSDGSIMLDGDVGTHYQPDQLTECVAHVDESPKEPENVHSYRSSRRGRDTEKLPQSEPPQSP